MSFSKSLMDGVKLSIQVQKEKAKNGGFSETEYNLRNKRLCDEFLTQYDLNTIEGIRAIPVSEAKRYPFGEPSVVVMPEQILSRQATIHKKAGRLDLAIECLYKANELRNDSWYRYTEDDYLRLVRYLKIARRYNEAHRVGEQIAALFGHEYEGDNIEPPNSYETPIPNYSLRKSTEANVRQLEELGTTFVRLSSPRICCATCGKYRGRVFSLTEKESRVPLLPNDFCSDCGMCITAFYWGISTSEYASLDELIKASNAPFIDTRTEEEITLYLQKQEQHWQKEINRIDYEWICRYLPEVAPKSLSGYSRIKSKNTANFQNLKQLATELGREI